MTTPLPRLTLVLGGARSGKSRHAEQLLTLCPPPWTYIATAEAWDDEMRERIAQHQARRGTGWTTLEAPLALADTIAAHGEGPMLVDCLTLWLTNVMLGATMSLTTELQRLVDSLGQARGPLILISNEVGLGIVPDNKLARAFRDAQGSLNQQVAAVADQVIFVAAGLPLVLKDVNRQQGHARA